MANHKSALKRARQSEKHQLRNKINKTKVKNVIKEVRATAAGSPEKAPESLKKAMSVISKAASRGTLHKKTASRRISRLSRFVAKAQAGGEA